ncbi:hypothetical protein DSCO28_25700 [Desulfosarcina ovata subsp. sediminis]|uniref:PilZ domain-containing protein n=1 Tax=Desulfosarcina ovata subsp. sediminis TaxID=885957 RepID=A0A5K7ZKV0_9BACT|nr:PilZ domain-containing protein [Desulfosarcina ovata]BBO82004.1 hypothetical protein DSCO28_25700 [Desulfosarcina ovata subsp. sediminis]
MKITAIIANIIQLAIILFIFFIRGPELGSLVIFLLFLLLAVPFINILTLLIDKRAILPTLSAKADGIVKREAVRIHYTGTHYALLTIDGITFTVRDLSEGGVRLNASSATTFKRKTTGEIRLLCGKNIRFKATVLRREEGAVVLRLSQPIGTATLVEEKRALAGGGA